MVIQVDEKHISRESTTPVPWAMGPSVPNLFGTPIYTQTV